MAKQPTVSTDAVAQDQIRAFFERWHRLEEEKQAISEDLKELFAEAKGNGFDTKVLRKLFRDKVGDHSERMEFEAIYELYAAALGMGPMIEADEPPARPARSAREIIEEFPADDVPAHDEDGVILEDDPSVQKAQTSSTAVDLGGEGGKNTPALPADTISPVTVEASSSTGGTDVGGDGGAKSTAARTDVRDNTTEGIAAPQPLDPEAGTTPPAAGRPPVDTIPETPGQGAPAAGEAVHTRTSPAVPGKIVHELTPPVSGIHRHEYLACFPENWGRAFVSLKEDILANGIREPIQRQGDTIIDGWSRYVIARELMMRYPVQEYAGDDPLRDIITLNMASRSLNLVERQAIAKKLIKLVPDRADEIGELLDLSQSQEAANENFGRVAHGGSIG